MLTDTAEPDRRDNPYLLYPPIMEVTSDKPGADAERYIFAERPRCLACGSCKLMAYKSRREGDGTITRYVRCAGCSGRYILVLE